ncbi:hypothetical protein Tco_1019131 [Tanacetum coccineum]|uniref:Uncharacterized protein n=1 Tax=Tanacetum coccineum TaxID=301880 RepID=A0ABQ5FW93_9ASTR
MSETEPIPPTSSVTALRIPIIKKGEYDLWSMKMRQYIAITDHILWDIITNGNQTTTDPASPSVSAQGFTINFMYPPRKMISQKAISRSVDGLSFYDNYSFGGTVEIMDREVKTVVDEAAFH